MKHNAGKCTFGCSSGEYFGKEDDMGRKAKISREMILSAAYSILDEEGISYDVRAAELSNLPGIQLPLPHS